MITTLTPNPSFDLTLKVKHLKHGRVTRAVGSTLECAGKGINVTRALGINGYRTKAVLPAGITDTEDFSASISRDGGTVRAVPIGSKIRTNVTVIEPDGTTTKINTSGPTLTDDECDQLVSQAVETSEGSRWLVASGSLPPGAPTDLYVRLAASMPTSVERLVVDTSGEALAAMRGVCCAAVKPNLAELAGITNGPLDTMGDVIRAAECLRASGWASVLVSLGRAGAVLVADDVCYGTVGVTPARNTTGAGDALLAGFVAAGGRASEALAEGLAWARAAISSPETVGRPVKDNDRGAVMITSQLQFDAALGSLM